MELFKPRTIIALLLYGTFCYLTIIRVIKPEAFIVVISALMTFYYSEKIFKSGENNADKK